MMYDHEIATIEAELRRLEDKRANARLRRLEADRDIDTTTRQMQEAHERLRRARGRKLQEQLNRLHPCADCPDRDYCDSPCTTFLSKEAALCV